MTVKFDKTKHVLGKMCKHGHDHEETGMSVRNKKTTHCIECNRMHYKKYYDADPDKFKSRHSTYVEKNSTVVSEYQHSYYVENKQKYRDACNRYRVTERGRIKMFCVNTKRRDALKTAGEFTNIEWKHTVDAFDRKCAYCGDVWEHIDHIVPLSKGGTNTIDNVAPACAQCNLSKNAAYLEEWYPKQTFYDSERHAHITKRISSPETV